MKTNNKFWHCLFTILCAMLLTTTVRAQVTIGDEVDPQPFSVLELVSNGTGGLRLPQLTTDQRNALGASTDDLLSHGLLIYNKDNSCIEYWNSKRWVSLCIGNANISFTAPGGDPTNPADRKDPTQPPFPPDGETRGPFVPHDSPECTSQTPPYTLVVMTGNDYTHINITNELTSEFEVTMDKNNSIKSRTAIVRVMNNCTGEYKEFLFSQLGLDENVVCDPSKTVPAISGWNGTDICNSGAAYLYLSGVSQTASDANDYIWTLDGREVGRGASYIATQNGTYCVYYKTIGCTQNSGNKTIHAGTNPAPNKIEIVVVENDGYVCAVGDEIKLVANVSNLQAGETVIWFKDDVRQPAMDNQSTIQAGVGTWYCAVINGSCSSLPSESKIVQLDPNADKGGTAINLPVVTVNGVALASATLCKDGMVMFEVTNPQAGVDYIWKLDNTEIGTGTSLSYLVPSTMTGTKVIRCTAKPQLENTCQLEAFEEKPVSTASIPETPYITVNTKDALCGGSATLTANFTGTATAYNWYTKDGTTLSFITSTGTDPNYTITQAGEYAVSVMADGCLSSISGSKTIVASDFGTISWTLQPTTANIGEIKTFSVKINPDHESTYNWTVTGGTITNGQGTNTITVLFPSAATATVSVQAENACGAVSGVSSFNVTVAAACTAPAVTQTTQPTQPIKVGQTASMSVTATGTPAPTYQWYSGVVGTTTTPISGQTARSYAPVINTAGTYKYWCKATNTCGSSNSTQITVTVNPAPSSIATGSGTLTGSDCFDIAKGNNNLSGCGVVTNRQSRKADFSQAATNTQTYTFKPSAAVSKVRFEYVESETGKIVQSFTPTNTAYATQTNITGVCTVKLVYKTTLNTAASGRTNSNALKVDIYAIYNMNANGSGGASFDRAVKLTVSIKDCDCCETVKDLQGNVYKTKLYGSMCMMVENLKTTVARNGTALVYANSVGTGVGTSNGYRYSAPNMNTANIATYGALYDFKSANNACPTGWHVPTDVDWTNLQNSGANGAAALNATTWKQNYPGYVYNGKQYNFGTGLHLGSSTMYGTTAWSRYLDSSSTSFGRFYNSSRAAFHTIRCLRDN